MSESTKFVVTGLDGGGGLNVNKRILGFADNREDAQSALTLIRTATEKALAADYVDPAFGAVTCLSIEEINRL